MPKAKIFIVEDETIVAMGLKKTLKSLGYEVPGTAMSGESALQKIDKCRPDLVMMDIQLKGNMDGIQTAEEVQRRYNIPVIYLTAFADPETLKRAKLTTPFGYLVKPFQVRELKITLQMALYRGKMERQLKASESRFRGLAESIHEGIAIFENGRIVFVNDEACRLFGKSREDLMGYVLPGYSDATESEPEDVFEDTSDLVITPMGLGTWIIDGNGERRCIRKRTAYCRRGTAIPYRYVILSDITDMLSDKTTAMEGAPSALNNTSGVPIEKVKVLISDMQESVRELSNIVSDRETTQSDIRVLSMQDKIHQLQSSIKVLTRLITEAENLDTPVDIGMDETQESELDLPNRSLEDIMDYLDNFDDYNGIIRQPDHAFLKRLMHVKKKALLFAFITIGPSDLSEWMDRQAVHFEQSVSEELINSFHGEQPPVFLPLSDDLIPPIYAVHFNFHDRIVEDIDIIEAVMPASILVLKPPGETAFKLLKDVVTLIMQDVHSPVYILFSKHTRFALMKSAEILTLTNHDDLKASLHWQAAFLGRQMTDLLSDLTSRLAEDIS